MPGDIEELTDLLRSIRAEMEASAAELGRTINRLRAADGPAHQDEGSERGAFALLMSRPGKQPCLERAQAVLSAATGCSPREAFEMMLRASRRRGVPLREVAAEVLRDPKLPAWRSATPPPDRKQPLAGAST